jgi:hypothetical protein
MPQGSHRCESIHCVSSFFSQQIRDTVYPEAVVGNELHVLVDEFCDFCQVGSDFVVREGLRCAAIHSGTHNGDFDAIEKPKKGDVLASGGAKLQLHFCVMVVL